MADPKAAVLAGAARLIRKDTNAKGVAEDWRRQASVLEANARAAFGQESDAVRIVQKMRQCAVMKTVGTWRAHLLLLMEHVDAQSPETCEIRAWVSCSRTPMKMRGWASARALVGLRRALGLRPTETPLAKALRRAIPPEARSRSRSRSPAVYDIFSSQASSESSIPAGQAHPDTPPPSPASPGEGRASSPHAVLGVPHGASPHSLRRSWREAALRHHPDKGGDAEAFQCAAEAARQLGLCL